MQLKLCYIFSLILLLKNGCIICQSGNKSQYLEVKFGNSLSKITSWIIIEFYSVKSPEVLIINTSENHKSHVNQLGIINEVLYATKGRTLVQLAEDHSKLQRNVSQFYNIFFIDSYKSFSKILHGNLSSTFDFMGYYTIVMTNVQNNSQDIVTRILKDCWELYIVNVHVVTYDTYNLHRALMYTYFPYTPNHCGLVKPVITGIFEENTFVSDVEIFPSKVSNFHGCNLTVGTFNVPPYVILKKQEDGDYFLDGFEGIMIRILSNRLNFSMIVKQPKGRWGNFNFENSTGAKLLLYKGEVNFTLGGFSLAFSLNDSLLYTTAHLTTHLTVMIPPGRPLTPIEKLFLPFDLNTWSCLSVCFIVSAIVVSVTKFIMPQRRDFIFGRANNSPFINAINVFLGGSLYDTPRRNFARFLLMLWILLSLVLRSSYQGALFKFLKSQNNVSVVDTLPKMLKNGFKIYGVEEMSVYFTLMKDYGSMYEVINSKDTDAYRFKTLDSSFKGGVAVTITTVARLNDNFFGQNIRFRTIKEKVAPVFISIGLRPHSYLKHPFETELQIYKESGLIDQWLSKFYNPRSLKVIPDQNIPQPLTLHQLSGIFVVYLILITLSFLIFLLEVLSKKSQVFEVLCNFLN
uniref:Uncharacterized protein n=1 Tax=Phlebotomus papatasi TaxID=29031 RepID=A0A3F2ZEL8_PHLPP